MGHSFVEGLEVERFHGIGPATAARMKELGIHTGGDLRSRTEAFLVQHFGKAGSHFHRISRGMDDRPVVASRTRKSSGSETTFPRDLEEREEIEQALQPLVDDVWTWCREQDTTGRTVTVKVKYSDFEQVTRSRTLPGWLGGRKELVQTAEELIDALFPLRRPVRLLGVSLSNLEGAVPEEGPQMALDF